MKIATRNLLAQLLTEALDDRITAIALRCLALASRAGAQEPLSLTVDQLLGFAPATDREAVGAKLSALPLLTWNCSTESGKVATASAFTTEWQEITDKLIRLSAVIQEWAPHERDTPMQRALKKGVLLFNHRLFFEVHEVLEARWRQETGEEKRFLQGLIQIAVALHHLQNHNLRGAVLLLQDGSEKLAPHQPLFLGIELQEFLRQVETCRTELLRLEERELTQFRMAMIPRMQLIAA